MKNELRQRMLRIMQPATSRLVKDAKIQEKAYKFLNKFQTIALYSSIRGEVGTVHLIERLLLEGKKVYLPVVEEEIVFRRITQMKGLKRSKFFVLEPVHGEAIAIHDIDAMVIPCLAVNKKGFRLGHGKGYYDRATIGYQGCKLAIIYEYQLVEDSFQETHDVKMDYIITENHIYKVGD